MSPASQTARDLVNRTVRTGNTAAGDRVREERWGNETVVWNKTEGRVATENEVQSTTWKS